MRTFAERWNKLINETRREGAEERVEPEPPRPDPEAPVRGVFTKLDAGDRLVIQKWLQANMDLAIGNAHDNHRDPAELTYQLGVEGAFRFLKNRLIKWAE